MSGLHTACASAAQDPLAAGSDQVLAEHADEIRRLGKRVVADVIEIGRRLTECKKTVVGHGNWLPWIEREFGWSDKTAERFMRVHALSGKFDNLSNLEIPLSGLYLLAAPSTSEQARTEIVERAEAGELVGVAMIKSVVNAHKKPIPPLPESMPSASEVADPEASAGMMKDKFAALEAEVSADPKTISAHAEPEVADEGESAQLALANAWKALDLVGRQAFLEAIGLPAVLAAIPQTWQPELERRVFNNIAARAIKSVGARATKHINALRRHLLAKPEAQAVTKKKPIAEGVTKFLPQEDEPAAPPTQMVDDPKKNGIPIALQTQNRTIAVTSEV